MRSLALGFAIFTTGVLSGCAASGNVSGARSAADRTIVTVSISRQQAVAAQAASAQAEQAGVAAAHLAQTPHSIIRPTPMPLASVLPATVRPFPTSHPTGCGTPRGKPGPLCPVVPGH